MTIRPYNEVCLSMNAYCPRCNCSEIDVLMAGYRGVRRYFDEHVFQSGDRVICKHCCWLGEVSGLNGSIPAKNELATFLDGKTSPEKRIHCLSPFECYRNLK